MTCWVEALALDAREAPVVSLATSELPRLIDVRSVVWSISSEWHVQRWDHHDHIYDRHAPEHHFFIDFDSKHVEQKSKIKDSSRSISKDPEWFLGLVVIMMAEVASIEVHDPIEVIMLFEEAVDHSTLERVLLWMLLLAYFLIRIVIG
jgi:hypothetical protein